MRALLAVVLLTLASSGFGAETYAEAQAQAKLDALNSNYREWYLQQMRPAFSQFMQPRLRVCMSMSKPEDATFIGLVVSITPEGKVKQVFVHQENSLTTCLQHSLMLANFPASPKAEFYFGLELRMEKPGSTT